MAGIDLFSGFKITVVMDGRLDLDPSEAHCSGKIEE